MKFVFKALFILLPVVAIGQNRTYIGLEVGPKFEVYQSVDNGDALYTQPFFYSPIYGLTIGQEINPHFTVETGMYLNNYGESYRIEGENGYQAGDGLLVYQIPLRLKARLDLIKEKLSLVTTVGYTIAINTDYGSSGSGSGFTSSTNPLFTDSIRTEDISDYSFQKTYGLLETGLALEYQFNNSFILSLAGNYMTGFGRISQLDVTYKINNEPEQTGTVFSNGDYFSVVVGLKYPISNLWTD